MAELAVWKLLASKRILAASLLSLAMTCNSPARMIHEYAHYEIIPNPAKIDANGNLEFQFTAMIPLIRPRPKVDSLYFKLFTIDQPGDTTILHESSINLRDSIDFQIQPRHTVNIRKSISNISDTSDIILAQSLHRKKKYIIFEDRVVGKIIRNGW